MADGNDIYIIYSGDLRNPDGTAIPFSISLKFTGRAGWKIKKVAGPPVGTYTKTGVAVSATAKVTVPYTLERQEQEISGNVFLVAVETKVNDTLDQKDDLIAVSLGRDEDLATDFSIRTNCYGLTASLAVKPGDGDIKFKETELNLVNGADVTTKLWGIKPSSAVDKTIIQIKVKKAGKPAVDVEELCTVFKGVTLEFEGNYYINVDTREFLRRPWDGRTDPKPNTKGSLTGNTSSMDATIGATPTPAEIAFFKKAVDQSFSFGYESAISFKDGDNPLIPKYKPWKDDLEVKVKK